MGGSILGWGIGWAGRQAGGEEQGEGPGYYIPVGLRPPPEAATALHWGRGQASLLSVVQQQSLYFVLDTAHGCQPACSRASQDCAVI